MDQPPSDAHSSTPLPDEGPQSTPDKLNIPAEALQNLGAGFTDKIQATATGQILQSVGGWRGIFEAVAPTFVFTLAFALSGQLWWPCLLALGVSVVATVWRLIEKSSLVQALAGMFGVLIGVGWSWWSGQGENFFAPSLLINVAYLAVFVISIVVRWPLGGLLVGFALGQGTAWRRGQQYRAQRRAYYALTWLWSGMFALRLAVKLPLYWAGDIGWLAAFQILLGLPLFVLVLFFSFLLIRPFLPGGTANTAGPSKS